MNRIHGRGYREAIAAAQRAIGDRLMQRLGHVQYVTGVDPVFIGLHDYTDHSDGYSYAETAHCCYPHHLLGPADRRVTTVVLPYPTVAKYTPPIIVHELGHALDYAIGEQHIAAPVTEYARTNREEAFAEAFTSWAWPDPEFYERPDDATLALFTELAA